jgi:hypothetical protein
MERRFAMTRLRLATLLSAIGLLLPLGVTVLAHHGWGEYDSRKPLTLTGTVKESGYENPHAFVDLDVQGKAWHAVLAPPSRMKARGVGRELLKPEATVTVIGFPHKSRATELKAEQITIDGKTTYIR